MPTAAQPSVSNTLLTACRLPPSRVRGCRSRLALAREFAGDVGLAGDSLFGGAEAAAAELLHVAGDGLLHRVPAADELLGHFVRAGLDGIGHARHELLLVVAAAFGSRSFSLMFTPYVKPAMLSVARPSAWA